MIAARALGSAIAAGLLLLSAGCTGDGAVQSASAVPATKIPVTVETATGSHVFNAEVAATVEQQRNGLMNRTDLGPDDAMIFTPYPADGPPREAAFWMKDTPTSLDIIFIRPDGTIARVAERTEPNSSERVRSGEPVGAVLEILAGRASELGIAAGDRVRWPGQNAAR